MSLYDYYCPICGEEMSVVEPRALIDGDILRNQAFGCRLQCLGCSFEISDLRYYPNHKADESDLVNKDLAKAWGKFYKMVSAFNIKRRPSMDELKPCPVCGSDNIVFNKCECNGNERVGYASTVAQIRCDSCCSTIIVTEDGDCAEERMLIEDARMDALMINARAVKLWNSMERDALSHISRDLPTSGYDSF